MSVLIKGMKMPRNGTYTIGIDSEDDFTVMAIAEPGKDSRICISVYKLEEVQDQEQEEEHERCNNQ